MRVSDSERQRTIDELGRHLAAGRLDANEYARRVEAAAVAVELGELDDLLADLPMLRIAMPDGTRRRRPPRQPGASSLTGWRAWGIVALTVIVLAAAIGLALTAEWVALVVLAGAWLLGLLQARLFGRR